MKTHTQRHEAPLLQTCPQSISWHAIARKRTRALRHHNSFEKNTSAAAGNLILMSEKQNTNKTKQQCSGKTQSDLARTHSHIQILPHLSAKACQNCSLSLPLQDYRQSAPETKPTHSSSMRTRSLCTRATNKKRSDIHLDNLRGLTAFSQSWQPEEGGEESSLIKQGLGRQMEPLAGC